MADTRGFDIVVEGTDAVILKALQGAWKSADCPDAPGDEGRIPEFMDLPAGTTFGGYAIASGQVQIPRDELGAQLVPAINGTEIKLGLHIQAQVQDPPVPSATLFNLTADIRARAPLGTIAGSKNVAVLFGGMARSAVSTSLTSGDPFAGKLALVIREFLHRAYENGSPGITPDPAFPVIPHNQDEVNVVFGYPGVGTLTLDTHTELYDDLADPARSIEVTLPQAGKVQITIPMYLRMFHLRPTGVFANTLLHDPMAVTTRLVILADIETPPGLYRVRLDTATVTSDAIAPAPGLEGSNYTGNKAAIGLVNLDTLVASEIATRGTALVHAMGATSMPVPTIGQIEQAIGDVFYAELVSRGSVAVWTPDGASSQFNVTDVSVQVSASAFAIAINAGPGANAAALTSFVPAGREFAIALTGSAVQTMIDNARVQNGFADSDLPKRMHEDDKDVDLNELDVFLTSGAIRMTGEVTVIDAIAGSIDVDADFSVDVGLHWEPSGALDASGVQRMAHNIIGDPEVDPHASVAFWIIAIILAVISFGTGSVLVGIIVIVVATIVASIASGVGGTALVDGVTGAVSGITAWPPELSRIGTVRAVFSDPIDIDTSGLVMSGSLEVVSSCEGVQVLAANSGGAYSVPAAVLLTLHAHNQSPVATYSWTPGDGGAAIAAKDVSHSYAASGTYVAYHALKITDPGGATSRHFALIDVRNVAPRVDAGADITVNEGELVTLVGNFRDVEYPDTHESMWFFDDGQAPAPGILSETNAAPEASGTSTVEHAWCDNGEYTVTLRVRDQNGGIGEDSMTVTVLNVPPTVDAGPEMFAYPCAVITLEGSFTDPGWCDSHVATWDFGDCGGPEAAVVIETNEAPAAEGTATASHVYERCGTYLATCEVVDDDGGVGLAATTIRVVDVRNGHFEDGFRHLELGAVANSWQPYALDNGDYGEQIFAAANMIEFDGRRAQEIRPGNSSAAGIWQGIGANPGWIYEIRSRYSIAQGARLGVRLGIDPAGGSDPSGASVIWSAGTRDDRWADLVVRAPVTGNSITVFIEVGPRSADGQATEKLRLARNAVAYFDRVSLLAIQPICPPTTGNDKPAPDLDCLTFVEADLKSRLDSKFERDEFKVELLDGQPAEFATAGQLPGVMLLVRRGLLVRLPAILDEAELVVATHERSRVFVTALAEDGSVVDRSEAEATPDAPARVRVRGYRIAALQIAARGKDVGLLSVCASHQNGGQGDRTHRS